MKISLFTGILPFFFHTGVKAVHIPNAKCVPSLTVELDPQKSAVITPSDIDNGSIDDHCTITSYSLDTTSVGCGSIGDQILLVTLTVTNDCGYSDSCVTPVTVEDNIEACGPAPRESPTPAPCFAPEEVPNAQCIPSLTKQLDSSKSAKIAPSDIDNGSTDAMNAIASKSLDKTSFGCNAIGDQIHLLTLTVTNACGNSDTCMTQLTVEDPLEVCGPAPSESPTSAPSPAPCVASDVDPNAECVDSLTVQLDASKSAKIAPSSVDKGSWDFENAITSYSLDRTSFGCNDIGDQILLLKLTVTNACGNSDSCSTPLLVKDPLEACGPAPSEAPTVAPLPKAQCIPSITFDLDASKTVEIVPFDLDDGSTSDKCLIDSYSLDKISFGCGDIGDQRHLVKLTVTNDCGYSDSCVTEVAVKDPLEACGPAPSEAPTVAPLPKAQCIPSITFDLDASKTVEIVPFDLDDGSTSDKCLIDSYSLDKTSFGCGDIGDQRHLVKLTVTNDCGYSDSCVTEVAVKDPLEACGPAPSEAPTVAPLPKAQCIPSITLDLDASKTVEIVPFDLDDGSTSDKCLIDAYSLDKTSFGCGDIGDQRHLVKLTVTNDCGYSDSCVTEVAVKDPLEACGPAPSEAPTVAPLPKAQCIPSITVKLDASKTAEIDSFDIDDGSTSDKCIIDTYTVDRTSFDCSSTGDQIFLVTLTVTNDCGYSDSCVTEVTVEDDANVCKASGNNQDLTVDESFNRLGLTHSGYAVDLTDLGNNNNEIQDLTFSTLTNKLSLTSSGGTVDLSHLNNEQSLTYTKANNLLKLTNSQVDVHLSSLVQDLSLQGNTLAISSSKDGVTTSTIDLSSLRVVALQAAIENIEGSDTRGARQRLLEEQDNRKGQPTVIRGAAPEKESRKLLGDMSPQVKYLGKVDTGLAMLKEGRALRMSVTAARALEAPGGSLEVGLVDCTNKDVPTVLGQIVGLEPGKGRSKTLELSPPISFAAGTIFCFEANRNGDVAINKNNTASVVLMVEQW